MQATLLCAKKKENGQIVIKLNAVDPYLFEPITFSSYSQESNQKVINISQLVLQLKPKISIKKEFFLSEIQTSYTEFFQQNQVTLEEIVNSISVKSFLTLQMVNKEQMWYSIRVSSLNKKYNLCIQKCENLNEAKNKSDELQSILNIFDQVSLQANINCKIITNSQGIQIITQKYLLIESQPFYQSYEQMFSSYSYDYNSLRLKRDNDDEKAQINFLEYRIEYPSQESEQSDSSESLNDSVDSEQQQSSQTDNDDLNEKYESDSDQQIQYDYQEEKENDEQNGDISDEIISEESEAPNNDIKKSIQSEQEIFNDGQEATNNEEILNQLDQSEDNKIYAEDEEPIPEYYAKFWSKIQEQQNINDYQTKYVDYVLQKNKNGTNEEKQKNQHQNVFSIQNLFELGLIVQQIPNQMQASLVYEQFIKNKNNISSLKLFWITDSNYQAESFDIFFKKLKKLNRLVNIQQKHIQYDLEY
ncbi:hypothetical protein ABPG72_017772 [Tetrahymena utriculariae]